MARKHKPEEIIGKPPGETSEPRASTALYRSYPGSADGGYHRFGTAVWSLWLSAGDGLAARCRVACEPQTGGAHLEPRKAGMERGRPALDVLGQAVEIIDK